MNHPKLKYPRLCRILTYVVVLGCGLLPIAAVFLFPVSDGLRVLVMLASMLGLLIYMVKNFMVLMAMDMTLAMLSCARTARRQYTLLPSRTVDAIRRSILRYGMACEPAPIRPQPSALRYRFSSPMTVYSSGIERVVAAYEVDMLDKELYRQIFSSAKINSKALIGTKKALYLDKAQRTQPLHRVTVILILAHRVDPQMTGELYELVCRQCGDEHEDCVLPCVVDLAHRTCVFNCVRVPYTGFSYAVKNRGIRIIKQRVFGGNLNLRGNDHFLPSIRDLSPEHSLWDLWKMLHHQMVGAERETKRRFEAMSDREIRVEGETLYLKWEYYGISQTVKLDTAGRTAKVESVTYWTYPKLRPIPKKTIRKLEALITAHFAKQGYETEFADVESIV